MSSPGKWAGMGPGLLWRSARRYALQHRWQTGLNMLGIMLGVMMVVAVDLANDSARQSFDTSLDLLNGAITHQVVGGEEGVPDAVFTGLKTLLGIRRAAPSISGRIFIRGRELTLVGVDIVSEGAMQRQRPGLPESLFAVNGNLLAAFGTDDGLIMNADLAASLDLEPGDLVSVATNTGSGNATLAAVFASPDATATGELVLADIAAAQRLLSRAGRLDSIDLVLDENAAAQVDNWLPANLALVQTGIRNDNLRQMRDAFHTNLLAMSLLSLLVAGLLIYNTVTLSVIRRRQTLGIFRAEGVTRGQLLGLVLGENAVTGLLASLAGVAAGFWLGRFLVRMVTATVEDLYLDLSASKFFVEPMVLVKGLVLGMALSFLSAALPAWRAARSRPVTLQHPVADSRQSWRHIPWLALSGAVILATGWVMLLPDYGALVTGFVALSLMVFGFCLMVPLILSAILVLVLACVKAWAGLPAVMALRNCNLAINRTGLAVAALSVAVSVTVGVGVMVGSFRGTVIYWLEQSLPGDFQLIAAGEGEFPSSLRDDLVAIEGVTGLHNALLEQVESEFGSVRLGVNDIPAQDKFYMREAAPGGLEAFDRGEGVFVSEPLAYLRQRGIGDRISLLTANGEVAFPILGVFHDYTAGAGLVHMHERLFRQHWPGRIFSRVTLDIDPALDAESVEAAIRSRLASAQGRYNLISNRNLRELTLVIFDRTFAITNVLRLLAILVAFAGVFSTLMALQLEKLRELAILRATGMTPGQVSGLVFSQTTVLGVCAGLLALPLGLLMADVLIDVINRRSFGWSMQHLLPESVLVEGFILAVIAAVLAGVYPAWQAGRIRPALALREE